MLIALRPLRKLRCAPVPSVLHSGFDVRELLRQWAPLISSLSRRYSIPRKLDPEDLAQILSMKLHNLRSRVDPVERPVDFRKLAKAELKNACIDAVRAFSAQKRAASLGFGIACRGCGSTARMEQDGRVPECPKCGTKGHPTENTFLISWIDIKIPDTHIGDSVDSSVEKSDGIPQETLLDPNSICDLRDVMVSDMVDSIIGKLRVFPDRCLFKLLLNPPRGMVDHAVRTCGKRSPDKWPHDFLATYLVGKHPSFGPLNKAGVRDALQRITETIARIAST